jgi:hypothetical protein
LVALLAVRFGSAGGHAQGMLHADDVDVFLDLKKAGNLMKAGVGVFGSAFKKRFFQVDSESGALKYFRVSGFQQLLS